MVSSDPGREADWDALVVHESDALLAIEVLPLACRRAALQVRGLNVGFQFGDGDCV